MRYTYLPSPLGQLLLVGDAAGLRRIAFPGEETPTADWQRDDSALAEAANQLHDYFAGRRTVFDLRLAPEGTPFQQQVWQALRKIPFGKVVSYGELARQVGRPTAARAVGAANGRNPLPIVIPCHRVIGSQGDLVGYSGGLHIKQQLLALESRTC